MGIGFRQTRGVGGVRVSGAQTDGNRVTGIRRLLREGWRYGEICGGTLGRERELMRISHVKLNLSPFLPPSPVTTVCSILGPSHSIRLFICVCVCAYVRSCVSVFLESEKWAG